MKKFFFILSYITLTNGFSNIITFNNICAKSKINLRMQNKDDSKDSFNLKKFDKKLDYSEFKTIVNIPKFDFKNSKTSIIIDNKVFDPLNCTSDIKTLKKYRNAEIKNSKLSIFASIC